MTGTELNDLWRHVADMGALAVFLGAVAYITGKLIDAWWK